MRRGTDPKCRGGQTLHAEGDRPYMHLLEGLGGFEAFEGGGSEQHSGGGGLGRERDGGFP